MKKLILLILFTFLNFELLFGQFVETPQYEFGSTSSYRINSYERQYTVPFSELNEPFSNSDPQRTIRRAPGYNPAEPGLENVPIGDVDVYLIVFLLVSYLICHYLKIRKSQMLLLNIQKQ